LKIDYLGRAKLLNLLFADLRSIKKLQKPDKIYLENPNLLYVTSGNVHAGTARETFVINQLTYQHEVEYAKSRGNFRVDGRIFIHSHNHVQKSPVW